VARSTSRQYYHHCPSTRNILASPTNLLTHHHQQQQVRYHRTDYEGPGKYGERETGSMFGGKQHDHSHEHQDTTHHQNQKDTVINEAEKVQLQQLLKVRYNRRSGSYSHRGYTIGIGGPGKEIFCFSRNIDIKYSANDSLLLNSPLPVTYYVVGSGKTALTLALCNALRNKVPMGVVTNDIFTQEDAEFLSRNDALSKSRILPVETGGCPHAAIREDVSANLGALELLTRRIQREEKETSSSTTTQQQEPLLLCESGGDNLAANFSSELADYTIYVIDVAGGDKVPRKGGPGITQSDLLVINKIDLAEAVGASLDVMERDANNMRRKGHGGTSSSSKEEESGPTIFASVKNGVGVDDIIGHIMKGYDNAHRLVESAR